MNIRILVAALLVGACTLPTAPQTVCPPGYEYVEEGDPVFRACERNLTRPDGTMLRVDILPR